MSLPNRPDRRSPVSADTVSRIIEESEARTLQMASPAGLVHQRGRGMLVMRRPSWSNTLRANRGVPYPFDISIVGTTATFRAGTINGLLPSNYLTGVTVVSSGTRYLVLNCTSSNGQITAASFAADSSVPPALAPTAGQPPTSFKILIGISIDAAPFKVWGSGNIQAFGREMFRLAVVSPVAGQLPYSIYYTWEFSVL